MPRHDEAIRWDDEKGYCDFLTGIPVTPEVFEDTAIILGGHNGNTDPDVYAAFRDFQADVSREERFDNYPDYVEDNVHNYEHLLRCIDPALEGAEQEKEAIEFWLNKLQQEHGRLFPMCGACGQQHRDPRECDLHPDKERRSTHVTIDLTVWDQDDPEAYVRQHLNFATADADCIYVDDVFQDDPE